MKKNHIDKRKNKVFKYKLTSNVMILKPEPVFYGGKRIELPVSWVENLKVKDKKSR